MRKKNLFSVITLAGLIAGSPLALAAEAQTKVRIDTDKPRVEADVHTDKNKSTDQKVQYREEARRENNVKKTNKATGLLGMEVRNHQNEKLGEIKDLVIDLPSGKVSYAVLAVGGFLGIGEKLMAIPPSALSSSSEGYLVLNADQARIQASPGFPATNWPDPQNPSFAALMSDRDSVGGAARTETRSERNVDVRTKTTQPRADVEVHTDKDKLYTDAKEVRNKDANISADRNKSVTLNAHVDTDAKHPNGRLLHGTVKSVDVEHNTMTIKTDSGETRTIHLDDQANLNLGRKQVVQLVDFKPGYNVTVGYEEKNGKVVAYKVEKSTAE